jgi:TetR/AcrR family transcriptional regulator, ethionamide resistance regulator
MTSTETLADPAVAARREQLSRRLLPVMERMLEDESFIEISIERLVREADVSRSGFYMYFADKGDLLRAMTTDVMGDLFDVAQRWWRLPAGATKQELRAALDGIAAAYVPHRKIMSAIVEAASYDRAVATVWDQLMEQAQLMVVDHIKREQKSGDIRTSVDVKRTAAWLTWMLERGLQQLVATAEADEQERLLQALTDIMWRTLYAPKD